MVNENNLYIFISTLHIFRLSIGNKLGKFEIYNTRILCVPITCVGPRFSMLHIISKFDVLFGKIKSINVVFQILKNQIDNFYSLETKYFFVCFLNN